MEPGSSGGNPVLNALDRNKMIRRNADIDGFVAINGETEQVDVCVDAAGVRWL